MIGEQVETIISDRGLIGWRAWYLVKPHYLLSLNHSALWLPGEQITAECDTDGPTKHTDVCAPVQGCSCGIYAHKTEDPINYADCWGEVYMWGKVVDHETGYRSQYAYPKQLFVTEKHATFIPILSGAYGVPVSVRPSRAISVRPSRERKPHFTILDNEVPFKVNPPTPRQFKEAHPGYKAFYEKTAELGVETSYDDRIARGMGRSVKIPARWMTHEQLLALMKLADRVTVGATPPRGSYKPYRFHFYLKYRY